MSCGQELTQNELLPSHDPVRQSKRWKECSALPDKQGFRAYWRLRVNTYGVFEKSHIQCWRQSNFGES